MKNNANKKGMTLVEVIIAMAVFASITTGFTMAASYCVKAQAKAKTRLTETNEQTTKLENYSGVIDYDVADVDQLETGANKWTMTYEFPNAGDSGYTITNDKLHGYTSKSSDEVLKLGFFSAIDRINLNAGEYWITIYNWSSDDKLWDISCSSNFAFFDNEGDLTMPLNALNTQGVMASGGAVKFGIKDLGGGNLANAVTIKEWGDTGDGVTIDLSQDGYIDDQRYGFVYFTDSGTFLTEEEFDAEFVSGDE